MALVYTFPAACVYLHRRRSSSGKRKALPPKDSSHKPQGRDVTLAKLLPLGGAPEVYPMKPAEQIPYYAPDGTSLGVRSMDATKRMIAGGFVKPSYGRKGVSGKPVELSE